MVPTWQEYSSTHFARVIAEGYTLIHRQREGETERRRQIDTETDIHRKREKETEPRWAFET